jgi:ferredoxin-NADP reductase
MRLTAIAYAAKDTNLYEFRRTDGANLPGIEPGAHIDIHLPNGMMRQYSLVTADGDPAAYVVGIKRDRASRGGSRYVHEYLGVAEILKIGGPRNHFPLIEDAPHSVLIAGGIGITPIWCMAQRLQKLGRSFELHYASRTRDEAAFLQELQKLPQAHVHIDAEAGGFLDLAPLVANAPAGSHFYCCGPAPMLAGYETVTKHVPAAQVHAEYFTAKEEAANEGGYVVELRKSELSLLFPKAAQSSKCCAMQASIRPIPASLACAGRARRR